MTFKPESVPLVVVTVSKRNATLDDIEFEINEENLRSLVKQPGRKQELLRVLKELKGFVQGFRP